MRHENIVFDLGGVVFARDPRKCPPELLTFSFVRDERMPLFWEEYDRGTLTLDEVKRIFAREGVCARGVATVISSRRSGCRRRCPRPRG
ncbi:MAG: hypothetical protein ACLS37_08305 [Alistipes sp.]